MKKILIYSDNPIYGYKSYADNISEICKLLKDNYEIYIIACGGGDYLKTESYIVFPQIEVFSGQNNHERLSAAKNIEYYSNLVKPDVIFFHTDTNVITMSMQDRKDLMQFLTNSNIPFIIYAVIDGLPIPTRDKDMFDFINQHGRVVTFSKFAKEAYPNSDYIPHGIDLDYFKPLINRKEIRNKCGISDDDVVIGFLGTPTQRKQPHRYFNLCKRLQNEYPNVKCCFFSQKNDVLAEHIHNHNIKFVDLSPTSHMVEFYSLLDIFVLPTSGEAFCKPFIECSACGVPIVTTDCCTGPELVTGHGELVKVAAIDYCFCCGVSRYLCDEEELYQKTKKLIDNKELRQKYSSFGIEFSKPYEWKLWKNKWLEVFESVFN
jgi:glycosyltransferase involved in cell wall biosynthesis